MLFAKRQLIMPDKPEVFRLSCSPDSAVFLSASPVFSRQSLQQPNEIIPLYSYSYDKSAGILSAFFPDIHNGKKAFLAVNDVPADIALWKQSAAIFQESQSLTDHFKVIASAEIVLGKAEFTFPLLSTCLFAVWTV